MKIFISADIEGVNGIITWDETEPQYAAYDYFRKQMTKEVQNACLGANAAGVKEIFIKDAHDTARNLILDAFPENAKVHRGWEGCPCSMMAGLDKTFDAVLFIGYHSPASSDGNPLAHTMNTKNLYVKINGKVASEFYINALYASYIGVPIAFLSGDKRLTELVKEENKNITTVVTKEGIHGAVVSQSPSVTNEEIKKQVEESNGKIMDVIYNTIDTNIANAVGAYLFPNYAYNFTLEQQKALLAKMPAETLNDGRIARIAKQIETLEKTAVGQKFIDFSMPDPEGNTIKLSDIISKNKYTLIDFWASWCGPCRAEIPNVIAAYKEYNKKGFGIVGVSLDNDAEKWKAAIKDLKMPWPHMSDLKGWQCEGAALYGVNSIPATVLVAQDGTIIERNLRGEAIKTKLAELLK